MSYHQHFKELQDEHLKKYSKSTHLSTAQVVYTAFAPNPIPVKTTSTGIFEKQPQAPPVNARSPSDLCDYVILLEKLYHPSCLKIYVLKDGYELKEEGEIPEDEPKSPPKVLSPRKNAVILEASREDSERDSLEEGPRYSNMDHKSLKGLRSPSSRENVDMSRGGSNRDVKNLMV